MMDPNPEIVKQNIGGDIDIQYLHYPCNGPVIIMLHATGFLPWLWHPIAKALSTNYRVIAPYFCDHRLAEPEDGGVSWMTLAQDLTVFCKKLSLENPFLVGHSMGATISAIAYVEHGLVAKKMVLIEPIFLPRAIYAMEITMDQNPMASKSIKRRNNWKNADEARMYLKSKQLFAQWDDEMMELYINYGMISGDGGGLTLACHPKHEAALFMGSLHFDPWPILPKIKCPVLVLEGETSESRNYIDFPKVASQFPNGQYRMVKNAGHLIPQERPGEITNIIHEFFSD